ncbi:transporter [Cognatilysobacter terrigena]|uniref:transporter n=1 Tax=Cognatilysobacter terrigena TaxID=2488749 RepID=UPI0010620529|nr:transporter [Lysobacter terrigena]
MSLILVIAVLAAIVGAIAAAWRPPGPKLTAALQHFAAGLVFAAAAAEVLPTILHDGAIAPVVVGGAAGIAAMLGLRALSERLKGPVGLITLVAIDILIDGLVLGLAFAAGEREGLVLGIALSVEVLFLGLAVTTAFEKEVPRWKAVAATSAVALLLPLGALLGAPAHALPPHLLSGLFSFALIALLYLVTEELLVEAHEVKDGPITTALFFVGFLLLIVLEEGLR